MPHLLLVLSLPGPVETDRIITFDLTRLTEARALELRGVPQLYRVVVDSPPTVREATSGSRRASVDSPGPSG